VRTLKAHLPDRARREARAWRRARIVREARAFRRRERARKTGAHAYTLREDPPARVFVRHDTLDTFVLEECFGRRDSYRPPAAVEAWLRGRPALRILDLGANIGLFGLLALRRYPGSSVVGYEPEEANAELHRRCIEANGLAARWSLERAFASNGAGVELFRPGGSALARAAAPGEPSVEVPRVDVFGLPPADFAKIDIEGAEWPILTDPRLASWAPGALVVECHGRDCPGPDPLATAGSALGDAGYDVVDARREQLGGGQAAQGVIWALRRAARS